MKWKTLWKWVGDVSDDFAAYVFTLAGVVLAQLAPYLATRGRIDPHVLGDWARLGISALVALYIVSTNETGADTPEKKAGKRANFKVRMANAFAHGVAWNTLMGMATGG